MQIANRKGSVTTWWLGGGRRKQFAVDTFYAAPMGIMLKMYKIGGTCSPAPRWRSPWQIVPEPSWENWHPVRWIELACTLARIWPFITPLIGTGPLYDGVIGQPSSSWECILPIFINKHVEVVLKQACLTSDGTYVSLFISHSSRVSIVNTKQQSMDAPRNLQKF